MKEKTDGSNQKTNTKSPSPFARFGNQNAKGTKALIRKVREAPEGQTISHSAAPPNGGRRRPVLYHSEIYKQRINGKVDLGTLIDDNDIEDIFNDDL